MLLRIEDTDRERSTEAATAAILDGLTWLGLDWDGEAISQFERAPRHREVAEELVATARPIIAMQARKSWKKCARRHAPKAARRVMTGAGAIAIPPRHPAGVKPVIRIKAPRDGETVVHDAVQGDVRFPNKDLDDFIILRSDGTPTYMHAVVVDDHDMGVTHIIRGDDHLTNAARPDDHL
ncbi:glutamyl-tRNA synthetase [Brucella melitensis]|nr:glutamyl-tRNA synthetase [Brucella melitensis]